MSATPLQADAVRSSACTSVVVDARTEELIAIGAAVAVHCQPCLTYHIDSARGLGLDEADIRAAMGIGQRVEMGAQAAMQRFAESAAAGTAAEAHSCCSGRASAAGKTCCSREKV